MASPSPQPPEAEARAPTFGYLALLGLDVAYPALTQLQSVISPDHFIAAARHSMPLSEPEDEDAAVGRERPIATAVTEDEPGATGEAGDATVAAADADARAKVLDFMFVESAGVRYAQDLGPGRLGIREAREAAGDGSFAFAVDRIDLTRGQGFVVAARYKVDGWPVGPDATQSAPIFADWARPRSFMIEATSRGPRVELRRHVPVWESSTPEGERLLACAAPHSDAPVAVRAGEWHTVAVRWDRGQRTLTVWSDGARCDDFHWEQVPGHADVQRTNHPEFTVGWAHDVPQRFHGVIEAVKVAVGPHADQDVLELIAALGPQEAAAASSPSAASRGGSSSRALAAGTASSSSPSGARGSLGRQCAAQHPATMFELGCGDAFRNVAGVPIGDEDLRLLFDTYDRDESGCISREEFKLEFQRFESFGLELTERDVDRIFNKYDVRRDGRLGFPEFALLMLHRSRM